MNFLMRRHTLLLLAFYFILSGLQGQSDDRLSKFFVGFTPGMNFSKTSPDDTANLNFSSRNKTGFNLGLAMAYNLKENISITSGLGMVNHGYRVYCDTLPVNNKIVRNTVNLTLPLGMSFRQGGSSKSQIHEKFGVVLNYNFQSKSDTLLNSEFNTRFRVSEMSPKRIYPTLYLGVGLGGGSGKGDRYEFGFTYQYSFTNIRSMKVEGGEFYKSYFPLNYRGGMLQATFTYYFNTGNLQKSDEYFY
jgi:hypothetical protein